MYSLLWLVSLDYFKRYKTYSKTSLIYQFNSQLQIWFPLLSFTNIVYGCLTFSNKFYTTKVDYWCTIPDGLKIPKDSWINISAPINDDNEFDKCHIFDIDYFENTTRPDEDTPTISCDSWTFDHEYYENTVIERWNLVCGNGDNFTTYSNSLFFLGNLCGIFLIGIICDWYGRKKGYAIAVLTTFTISIGVYFIQNPYLWMASRFLSGCSIPAMITASNVWQVFCKHSVTSTDSVLDKQFGKIRNTYVHTYITWKIFRENILECIKFIKTRWFHEFLQ